jgi:hypothetical protein
MPQFVALTVLFSWMLRSQWLLYYAGIFLIVIFSGYPIHWAITRGRFQSFWVALVLGVVAGGLVGLFSAEIFGAMDPLSGRH